MELIMKLITRLVEAVEKQATNSDKLVLIAQEQLENTSQLLALQKANYELATSGVELVSGAVETIIHAPGDGNTPAGQAAAKEHAEINDGDAQQHVSQAALDAAEAASKAAAAAKKAAAEKAAKDKAEQAAAQTAVEAKRKADLAEAQAKQQAADAAKSETKKKITVDDVRAALRKYATAHGNEAAMGILQKHEAVSVSAIDPSKYEAVLADLA